MTTPDIDALEVGFDIPARPGMAEGEIVTPALIVDLDPLERNLRKMAGLARDAGVALRPHGKMHKSVDVARLQAAIGGAVGMCCQTASEAEAFVRGGIADVLVSNEVRDPVMITRLAALPLRGARVAVCVDDIANVAELAGAAMAAGTELGCLVDVECGAGRCGVPDATTAAEVAQAINAAPGLRFQGVQAYQGSMQHIETHAARKQAADASIARARAAVDAITATGLLVPVVTGAGTGSFVFEAASGLYSELQCGSYAFMDADYGRIEDENDARLDAGMWDNALFVLTGVMSAGPAGRAVVDAGLKVLSLDSGLPQVWRQEGVRYAGASDEHGVLDDPDAGLSIGDKLRLVPGHCDPTVNLHDWLVGVRGGVVECLWPVSARGKSW